MSATDNILMYPEARTNLQQLGFDSATQTIQELCEDEYIKPMSTVVEYVDSVSDTKLLQSIADISNIPYFNNTGCMLIAYKSAEVTTFILLSLNNELQYTFGYHNETGFTSVRPLGGFAECSLENTDYVSCRLRKCGFIKILRIGGYSTKTMTKGTRYTLGVIPEKYGTTFTSFSGSVYQTGFVTSDQKVATIEIVSADRKIYFTPRSETFNTGLGINYNLTFI